MEKTAKEFWDNACTTDVLKSPSDIMIEFAKMHVEAALKEASEKINLTDEVCEALQNHWFNEYIDKDSILNSYPLENIK
jgi:hypothetical protein